MKQLEEQLQEMQKLANDDTQSEDRRSLLMRCDRAETRARKNEEQMMVNLPPLFLGHFSPIFARLFPVFSPFPPSFHQDSGNRHQDPERRSVTVEKRRVKTAIWVSLLRE